MQIAKNGESKIAYKNLFKKFFTEFISKLKKKHKKIIIIYEKIILKIL